MSSTPAPHPHLDAYGAWIRNAALPTWGTRGFDMGAGRFRERLDRAGEAIDVPHRSMVQARQIYVFSHAALIGWYPEGGALAETAMASLLRDFRQDEGERTGFAFSIDGRGGIASNVRDAYAHAFVLFSIAALYRLNGDAALLEVADRTIRFIDATLTDPAHGGLFDAVPVPGTGEKRQNPHMHLLEAFLFLEHAAPGRGYLEQAGGLVALFKQRFFDPAAGVLLEYFAPDWSAAADPVRATTWEPGHHFEWVWLLGEYAKLSGESAEPWLGRLHDNAVGHGIAANGLIYDELTADMRVVKGSHRVWPHTEAIKAAVTRDAAGDATAVPLAEQMADGLLRTFLDRPFTGGWIDHVDAAGNPLTDFVPASTLYHLFLAATEAARGFPAASPQPVA